VHRTVVGSFAGRHANSPPSTGRVHGLGIADALRVELEPLQVGWFVDEVDTTMAVLLEALEDPANARECEERAYELQVLAMIREQVPAGGSAEPIAVVGPMGTMTSIVSGAVRSVTGELSERVDEEEPRGDARAQATLRQLAAAAHAWTETYLECQAVEHYAFDTEYSPVRHLEVA
jgi:hypothetical protein